MPKRNTKRFKEAQKAFGAHLRRIMSEKDITLVELAKRTKIGRSTFYRYLDGGRIPQYDTLLQISKALRVPVSELFTPPRPYSPYNVTDPKAKELLTLFAQLTEVGKQRILHAAEWELTWLTQKRR